MGHCSNVLLPQIGLQLIHSQNWAKTSLVMTSICCSSRNHKFRRTHLEVQVEQIESLDGQRVILNLKASRRTVLNYQPILG